MKNSQQASKTKERIFIKATELFNESGFENVTIRQICKSANVAIGTFYLYFKSKHEILYEIYRKADEIFENKHVSDKNDVSAFNKIMELIKIQVSVGSIFHLQSDAIKQLYIFQLSSDNQYFLSEDRKFHKQLCEIVDNGQKLGEIRSDMSSHDICWRILRFSRGLIFDWCLHDCKYDIMDFSENEMKIYLELFRSQQQCL
jgi:TetR/AcrR family transcriptional regulator, fatty acid metabolism regulator protein